MSNKQSVLVHLYNKYPQHRVIDGGDSISVVSGEDLKLVMRVEKTAHGVYECVQAKSGAREAFDLSPISKDARVYKLHADGSIGKDELAPERKKLSEEMVKKHGKIISVKEEEVVLAKELAEEKKRRAEESAERARKLAEESQQSA